VVAVVACPLLGQKYRFKAVLLTLVVAGVVVVVVQSLEVTAAQVSFTYASKMHLPLHLVRAFPLPVVHRVAVSGLTQ
jgi:hypothetical protein